MTDYTTWRKSIENEMEINGEKWGDLVAVTLTDAELAEEFYRSYGGTNGKPFTAWTNNFVYFPCAYDGSEWCGSTHRNPNGKPTEHQGG